MIFFDYAVLRLKYHEAQTRLDEILSEKEDLFERTQPKSPPLDRDRIDNGTPRHAFDEYLIEKERKRIDERLAEAGELLAERERLLNEKEAELRASADTYDRVYRMRFLEHKRVHQIAGACHYSEMQIYRILSEIKKITGSQ